MALTVHVVPEGDLCQHIEIGDTCWCLPDVELYENSRLIIHHAADERDVYEGAWVKTPERLN